jgi:prepilin-type N-terminal cleavage/methylation domain-containing protein
MKTHHGFLALRTSLRRGFTLIELVIAISIVAVLAGAAIPVTAKVLTYKARKATREELQVLGDAALEHFRDTRTIPTTVSSLMVDSNVAGWSGPYLGGAVTDQLTGTSGFEVDAWSRSYRFTVSGDQLTIASRAEDATFGNTDDLSIVVDVGVARREETVAELKLLNQSINAYNATYLATAPLSMVWSTAYSTLVTRGFLPTYTGYLTDGWGQAYVPVGTGSPLVELTSTNLAQN